MAEYLMSIEEPIPSHQIFALVSILFLVMVGLDKLIVFRRVISMERMLCQVQQVQPAPLNHQEYMLTLKKFSTSEMHFKMTIALPLFLLAIGIIILNNIFRENEAVRTLTPKLPTKHN